MDGEYRFPFILLYRRSLRISKDASQKRPGSPLVSDHGKRARSVPQVIQNKPCKEYGASQCTSCLAHAERESPSLEELSDDCKFIRFHWFHPNNFSEVGGFIATVEEENSYEYHDWKPNRTAKHIAMLRVRFCRNHSSPPFNQ